MEVWNLTADGYIIADFEINGIKGRIYQAHGQYVSPVKYDSTHFWVYDYDNEILDAPNSASSGNASQFIAATGTTKIVGNPVNNSELILEDIMFRAVQVRNVIITNNDDSR